MNEPKVLVAAPIYSGKDYIFKEWYNLITHLNYPNYDWLIVDNSRMESYAVGLRRKGYQKVIHIPRGGNSRKGIARASEYIRRYAINNGYDYIMFIESDLLPPKDIIQRLMKHNKLVCGATYEIGLHGSKDAPRRPIYYEKYKTETGDNGLRLMDVETAYSFINTGLMKCPAFGFGSTLIHKSIFSKYSFKYDANGTLHSDMVFYWELHNDGVECFVDTDIVVPHFNQNWAFMKDY